MRRKKKQALVYMATHKITGERYIGFTLQALPQRRSSHWRVARAGCPHGKFPKAVLLYGLDAFDWRVLASFDCPHQAMATEQDLIKRLRPEYNATKGGQGFRPRLYTESEREKSRKLGFENLDKWRRYSHLGPAAMARRVVCLNDGEVYESASAAARAYSICKSGVIEVCLRYERRCRIGGLVFRYHGDHHAPKRQIAEAMEKYKIGKSACGRLARKPVIALSDGDREFESAASAAAHYKLNTTCIAEACRSAMNNRGKRRLTVRGMRFRYKSAGTH